jgi:prepilin-type N-terminal cleavage/methylation domain-containing protein
MPVLLGSVDHRRGFTLTEIIVVIAIMMLLMGFTVSKLQVNDQKSLDLDSAKLVDAIEYAHVLADTSQSKKCASHARLASVSLKKTSPTTYTISLVCENNFRTTPSLAPEIPVTSYSIAAGTTFSYPSTTASTLVMFKPEGMVRYGSSVTATTDPAYAPYLVLRSSDGVRCICVRVLESGLGDVSSNCTTSIVPTCSF